MSRSGDLGSAVSAMKKDISSNTTRYGCNPQAANGTLCYLAALADEADIVSDLDGIVLGTLARRPEYALLNLSSLLRMYYNPDQCRDRAGVGKSYSTSALNTTADTQAQDSCACRVSLATAALGWQWQHDALTFSNDTRKVRHASCVDVCAIRCIPLRRRACYCHCH